MKIALEWAITRGDSGDGPCEWCEAEYEPCPVIVRVGPHGHGICPGCADAILRRGGRGGVAAGWPT